MDILVVGGGGREHALVWKLKQSAQVRHIFAAPGNAGTSQLATNLALETTDEIVSWLREHPLDLVVIGPDNYLAEGLVDKIREIGLPVFGPTKAAAEIEWSKYFAKKLMQEEGIPTAAFQSFSNFEEACRHIQTQKYPLVIKVDGLALGKGVLIAQNISAAQKALEDIMKNKLYGQAGHEVVIEEYLTGEEISLHAFCDGTDISLFPPAQDHKRISDGDIGPNTGGMGTIAPVPGVTDDQVKEIEEKIIIPLLVALKKRNRVFQGVLYPGIMLTPTGPKVIEFNARFGDPETQSYLRLLESDLVGILLACTDGTLKKQAIRWSDKYACCIVCASAGYPGSYEKGAVVSGVDIVAKDCVIFQAGTKILDDKVVTNGGRVLGVTAVGTTLSQTLTKAYQCLKLLSFSGMHYRRDIGAKHNLS